jgi:thiamine biosynthesis lipoprotein
VSALLFEALAVAQRAAQLSDGDVDPTVGRALELAGYDRDFSLLAPARQAPANELQRPQPPRVSARVRRGWRTVELDERTRSVRVPRGIALDLGASAKAWAADRGAAAAARDAGCGALLGIGGDIATSGEAPLGGWRIRVTDDHRSDPSAPGQSITIESGGLATSSTAVRRWSHRGRDMHHIIDPSSGEPVRPHWRTVSVAAGDCTDANTAATAAIVRRERAEQWLEAERLPARLVDWRGKITTLAGWPS